MLSALSGGISGGLSGVDFTGEALSNVITRSAMGNALTQGLGVATGLQPAFSWKALAASGVGAGVGQTVAPGFAKAFDNNAFATRLATGLTAGAAAAVARGGRVTVQQVAADAFGNALGQGLVDQQTSSGQPSVAGPMGTRAMGASATIGADDEIGSPTFNAQPAQPGAIATPVRPYPPDNSVPLPHMADLPRPRVAYDADGQVQILPPIENLYQPVEGFFQGRYRMAQSQLTNPNSSAVEIGVNTVLGAGVLIPAMVETPATALYNSVNNFYRGGQLLARADMTTDSSEAVKSRLEATVEISNGTVGMLGAATLVPTRPGTARIGATVDSEVPATQFGGESTTRMDLSSKFTVSRESGGVKVQYGDPSGAVFEESSHGIVGFVDKNGVLGVDVYANPALRAQYGSGTDMFNSMMTRLRAEGVEVNGVRGAWLQGTDSVNYVQYQAGLKAGLEPAQAALNTWTGKLVQNYGYTHVESITGTSSNVYVLFRKPGG
jgi:hypothetical protein